MKYAGVVVLYNPDDRVIDNINSYIEDLDILYLIDNSSENHENRFNVSEKIKYIPFMENKGIAVALNHAAKLATEFCAEWLLTMDQDSKFQKNSLLNMKQYIEDNKENEKLAIVSPFHNTTRAGGAKPQGIEEPIIVMTSGNLVNLNIFSKGKGFKESLFIDCVDFDFCLQLKRHGYDIIQLPDAILDHELGETIRKEILGRVFFVDNHNYIRRYYIVRNRHYIYDEFHTDFPLYCEAEIKCTRKEVVKIILFEKNKVKKLIYMFRGYLDYRKGKVGKYNE